VVVQDKFVDKGKTPVREIGCSTGIGGGTKIQPISRSRMHETYIVLFVLYRPTNCMNFHCSIVPRWALCIFSVGNLAKSKFEKKNAGGNGSGAAPVAGSVHDKFLDKGKGSVPEATGSRGAFRGQKCFPFCIYLKGKFILDLVD
jgi:hypothetical protein